LLHLRLQLYWRNCKSVRVYAQVILFIPREKTLIAISIKALFTAMAVLALTYLLFFAIIDKAIASATLIPSIPAERIPPA